MSTLTKHTRRKGISERCIVCMSGTYVLTEELIIKECVRLGFYRTPSCNEKLYLHHKGFDTVDPAAFERYTDVKVLWLEGNCLSQLPCGALRSSPKASAAPTEEAPAAKEEAPAATKEAPAATESTTDAAVNAEESATATLETNINQGEIKTPEVEAPTAPRDMFTTMYPTLRQLLLHGNMFASMPNLHAFEKLDSLNLSDNFIKTVKSWCPQWVAEESPADERADDADAPSPQKSAASLPVVPSRGPVDTEASRKKRAMFMDLMHQWTSRCAHTTESRCLCGTLSTLYFKNNHLTTVEDIAALLCFKNLSVLDLSNNRLEDGDGVLLVLENMPNLKVLYLSGNPCVRAIPNYRRTVLTRCKQLLHLDDRPVFDDERRLVTAWAAGGVDAERKEKQLMREEEDARQRKRLQDFREMMMAARQRQSEQENRNDENSSTTTEDETDSNPTPDSSDAEAEGSVNRIESSSNNRPRRTQEEPRPRGDRRVLSQNRPQPKPAHTDFYEMNYGSKSEAMRGSEAVAVTAQPPNADPDGGVSFGTFRVVPKKSPAPTTSSRAIAASPAAAATQRHCDPMAMPQASASSPVDPEHADDSKDSDDDGDDAVCVPPTASGKDQVATSEASAADEPSE